MKKYYSDYTRHCLRFALAYPDKENFKRIIDKNNWDAATHALKLLEPPEKEAISELVKSGNMTLCIDGISRQYGIPVNRLWKLLEKTETAVAVHRGLI